MPAATVFSLPMLYDKVVIKIQDTIIFLLTKLVSRLPEPTKENTGKHNSHILIDIRDYHLAHEDNPSREKAYKAIWNTAIIKNETCNYYSDRFDEIVRKLKESDWVLVEGKLPQSCWRAVPQKSNKELRKKRLVEALNKGEADKVLSLID